MCVLNPRLFAVSVFLCLSDVTLPSNLIRTSGSFLTDPCTEVVSVSSRRGGSWSQPRVSEEQGFLPAEISQIYEEMAVIHEKLQVQFAEQIFLFLSSTVKE